jgi:hypothetical protein
VGSAEVVVEIDSDVVVTASVVVVTTGTDVVPAGVDVVSASSGLHPAARATTTSSAQTGDSEDTGRIR